MCIEPWSYTTFSNITCIYTLGIYLLLYFIYLFIYLGFFWRGRIGRRGYRTLKGKSFELQKWSPKKKHLKNKNKQTKTIVTTTTTNIVDSFSEPFGRYFSWGCITPLHPWLTAWFFKHLPMDKLTKFLYLSIAASTSRRSWSMWSSMSFICTKLALLHLVVLR